MIAVSELNIYFHSPGQIMRTSQINRRSSTNRKNVEIGFIDSTVLTDWEITLSIEVVDFSEVQGPDCVKEQQSYDQCIQSQFLQKGNNSKFANIFLARDGLLSSSGEGPPIDVIQDYYATIISQEAVSQCSSSCSYIQVQFEQNAKRDVVHISSLSMIFNQIKKCCQFCLQLLWIAMKYSKVQYTVY